ncbi:MAG: gliding motility lipoprotein GldH [Muribaculaceae bacterium]
MIILLVCLGSCQPKHTDFSEFRHIPSCGWLKDAPLHFSPVYADSAHLYTLSLAVRHDSEYAFSNAGFTVDLIGNDTLIERRYVNLSLADTAGNWLGSGFGALYQKLTPLRSNFRAGEVTKVVVWQCLDTDTLSHITDVGIILN